MAFSLEFTDDFFFCEDDRSGFATDADGNPASVYSAVCTMDTDEWRAMCEDVFPGIEPEYVTPESVVDKIRATDTCRDLSSPIEVYIDPEGDHSVLVYENTAD